MPRARSRTRYAVLLSALLVVAALLVSVVHLIDARRAEEAMQASSPQAMHAALHQEVEETRGSLANMLADSLIEPFADDDFERLHNITSAARRLPNIIEILVYDALGLLVHDGTTVCGASGTVRRH